MFSFEFFVVYMLDTSSMVSQAQIYKAGSSVRPF